MKYFVLSQIFHTCLIKTDFLIIIIFQIIIAKISAKIENNATIQL